ECVLFMFFFFFFSSRRRHTRFSRDWSSDVCSSDLAVGSCSYHQRPVSGLVLFTAQLYFHPCGGLPKLRDLLYRFDNVGNMFCLRSEERRVGKECRSGWSTYREELKSVAITIERIVA